MPSSEQKGGGERPPLRMELMRSQREANEQLLLASLRANEQADDAQGAQQRAEQEVSVLRAGEQELRTTAEFRERLIGIIGHDLRTPLQTIMMAGELLNSGGDLTPSVAGLVRRIVSSALRMERMISQLADFTRARLGGGFTLQVAQTNMGELCREVADELRLTSQVQLELQGDGNLCGEWDADRLTQALSNIASNAVDHATAGTPVRFEMKGDGDWVQVQITNRGTCIPPELLPIIFTAFRRAKTRAGDRSGHLGLGLFVACEVTRAHGGTLEALSSDGMTAFTMRLPRESRAN